MIRKTWNNDKWLVTAQPEHARLSAIIAASWTFPGARPNEEVFKAIMSHDDGWKEAEEIPGIKKNGDPLSFNEIKLSDATPIYARSINLCEEKGRLYGASLIAGHFIALVETNDLSRASTRDAIAAGQFLARERKHLRALKSTIEEQENGSDILKNYDTDLRFLQVCDYLSLLLCTDFDDEHIIKQVPYLNKGDSLRVNRIGNKLALSLKPLPFKKNLRDHLTSRILPIMPYDSPEELKNAIDEIKTVTNEVHLGSANN